MELPSVSLHTAPASPLRVPGPSPVDARGDGRIDAPGDGRVDAPGDGRADVRGDTRQDAAPAAGALLMFPAAATGGNAGAPVITLSPRRPAAARALDTITHWAALWWAAVCRAAANPRGLYHAHPESLAEHDAYRRARGWVPAGHAGRVTGPAGAVYAHTFGRAGLATGYLWAWLWARPMRLLIGLAVVTVIYLAS